MKHFAEVAFALAALSLAGSAQTRVYYGGGHHTYNHGRRYAGGNGSSHRGGHNRNVRTSNRYGRHK